MDAWKTIEKQLGKGTFVEQACALILGWGSTDGAHHKQWVLDQTLRLLTTSDEYENLITAYESSGYEWDTGIAP